VFDNNQSFIVMPIAPFQELTVSPALYKLIPMVICRGCDGNGDEIVTSDVVGVSVGWG
jgi:hypothetical protein